MEIFRMEDKSGRLLSIEPDEKTRFKFLIWFLYTQELMNSIKDGDLIAVPNFQSKRGGETVYSILKITNILPKHFALKGREDAKSYPGYVIEALKNIAASWTEQEKESLEDTTIIECEAVPTNLQFKIEGNEIKIEDEKNIPMAGEEVKLLSPSVTMQIINGGIRPDIEDIIEIGNSTRDEKIKILIRVDDLIKIHFGIFGFTGVGKSNLISTLISKLLKEKVGIEKNETEK